MLRKEKMVPLLLPLPAEMRWPMWAGCFDRPTCLRRDL